MLVFSYWISLHVKYGPLTAHATISILKVPHGGILGRILVRWLTRAEQIVEHFNSLCFVQTLFMMIFHHFQNNSL